MRFGDSTQYTRHLDPPSAIEKETCSTENQDDLKLKEEKREEEGFSSTRAMLWVVFSVLMVLVETKVESRQSQTEGVQLYRHKL